MSTVEIRHYGSMAAYQEDAARMAAGGWKVAAQSSEWKLSPAGSVFVVLGIFTGLAAFLLWFPLAVLGGVFVVIGAFARQTTYTVTYQPG